MDTTDLGPAMSASAGYDALDKTRRLEREILSLKADIRKLTKINELMFFAVNRIEERLNSYDG